MADNGVTINVHYTDKRTIELKRFNDHAADLKFAHLIADAVREGYTISTADTIEGGTQRDPYTIGIRIVLERKEPPKPQPGYRDIKPLTSRAFS